MKLTADFILIIGIVLNVLALVGLLRIKQKQLPQIILIVYWFFILDTIIFFYSRLHELNTLTFITNYLEDGVRFFIPPLVYIYVKSIFQERIDLIRKNLFHFIPFALYFTIYTVPKSLSVDFSHIGQIDQFVNWALVQDSYGILYFILCLKLFYMVSKTMKQSYSNLSIEDFFWLEKFLISFLIVLAIDLLITISEISFGYIVSWDGYITVFFMIFAMAYIGHYGLTQSTVFLPSFLVPEHIVKTEKDIGQKFYLNESQKYGLKKKYNELMHKEKLYLLPDLNLKILANRMQISERMLSAFFNEVLNGNFYDSINNFRVNEAKERLISTEIKSYTIAGIGLSSGFSSKSSFYRVFKKTTGLSPSKYKEKVINESQYSQ